MTLSLLAKSDTLSGIGGVAREILTSQLTHFLKPATSRRNFRLLLRFLLVLAILVTVYSILFHVLMVFEGRQHSWITGFDCT